MSEEGKQDVEAADAEEVKPDPATGKLPEMIPSKQYIATKESLGRKLDAEKERAKSLEEQLKNAPNVEEFNRIKEELESTKTKLTEKEGELTKVKEATVSEMRGNLKKRGVSEEKVNKMTEAELRVALDVLGDAKPAPDLGGGGGTGELKGSPMELAAQAYSQSKK